MIQLKTVVAGVALLCSSTVILAADAIKPFYLADTSSGDIATVSAQYEAKLKGAGFEVVGSYSPYDNAKVIAFTNSAIKAAAAKGEMGGYAAAVRVGFTTIDGTTQVGYNNPTYMAHAFRLEGDMADISEKVINTLGKKQAFGAAEGVEPDDLRDYHYTFGMPYFDEPEELATHDSYQAAVDTVEANLAKGVSGITKVYRIDIPGKDETVFGVAMKGKGDQKFQDDSYLMSEIDFKPLRSTAHLPYEILVSGNQAYTLSAKFRIAMNFPDLSMMGDNSFMNIMDAPGAIAEALGKVASGS